MSFLLAQAYTYDMNRIGRTRVIRWLDRIDGVCGWDFRLVSRGKNSRACVGWICIIVLHAEEILTQTMHDNVFFVRIFSRKS